jgi:hypothetical protein
MEFLAEFEINVPNGTPKSEVESRTKGEAAAAARLVEEGHLVRLWQLPSSTGKSGHLGCTAPLETRSSTICSAFFRSATGCTSP